MCQHCDADLAELATIAELTELEHLNQAAALTELEQIAMVAELAAGVSAPDAGRLLLPHEKRAKVRFGDIYDLMGESMKAITGKLNPVAALAREEIYRAVDDRADMLPWVVMELRELMPSAMAAAQRKAADDIERILINTYRDATGIVLAEAKRQGVKVKGLKPLYPDDPFQFAPAALSAALQPWALVLNNFQRQVTDPKIRAVAELATIQTGGFELKKIKDINGITREIPVFVQFYIDSATTKVIPGLADVARQDVNLAHGAGRLKAAQKFKPAGIWASELLDGATCGPCETMDGKEYKTVAAARKDYPEGPYINCKGGARCRGTLVFEYGEPDPEEWKG